MIINDSLKLNEVKSINLSNGSTAYKSGDKYYIKKGDTKKEISVDQYNKLKSKDVENTTSKSTKSENKPTNSFNDRLMSRLDPMIFQDIDKNDPDMKDLYNQFDEVSKVLDIDKNKLALASDESAGFDGAMEYVWNSGDFDRKPIKLKSSPDATCWKWTHDDDGVEYVSIEDPKLGLDLFYFQIPNNN